MSDRSRDEEIQETQPALLRVLSGEVVEPHPLWIMRQAGRYLPEYREVRSKAGGFLDLCYTPSLAVEVTMQPIRRFGLDAAILFSDILVVPDALGQEVAFVEGEGPVLGDLDVDALEACDGDTFLAHLGPVFETVAQLRSELPASTALIGFCGAPWTVATYMVGGRGSPDQAAARTMAYHDPDRFGRLIERLTVASIAYLSAQVTAGADVIQIFDTWAGSLDEEGFERWVVAPTKAIVEALRQRHPAVRIIGFPKGAGIRIGTYVRRTGVDGIGLDWSLPLASARSLVDTTTATQGNLDPFRLIVGGKALDDGIDRLLAQSAGTPHIVNLGHGITPATPVAHVEHLVRRVRNG